MTMSKSFQSDVLQFSLWWAWLLYLRKIDEALTEYRKNIKEILG